MRQTVRPIFAALSIAVVAMSTTALSTSGVQAQAKPTPAAPAAPQKPPPVKQMPLTQKQIDSAIATMKEMDSITAKLPQDAKTDPKIVGQLQAAPMKNGFASADEYNSVIDNISLVFDGLTPQTPQTVKYVGQEALLKAQVAQVQADKKMSAADKKKFLAILNEGLKSLSPAVEYKGNIDLVIQNYDKLEAVLAGGYEH